VCGYEVFSGRFRPCGTRLMVVEWTSVEWRREFCARFRPCRTRLTLGASTPEQDQEWTLTLPLKEGARQVGYNRCNISDSD
jgi:hypothetical protein